MTQLQNIGDLSLERDMVVAVLMEAYRFQQLEELRKESRLAELVDREIAAEYNQAIRFSISDIHSIAEQAGIATGLVDRVLEMRFPSPKRQLEALNKMGAIPSFEMFFKHVVSQYVSQPMEALSSKYPSAEFDVSVIEGESGALCGTPCADISFYLINHTTRTERVEIPQGFSILPRRKQFTDVERSVKQNDLLAKIYIMGAAFPGFNQLYVDVYSPIFALACSDTIRRLGRLYPRSENKVITYHFKV